MKRFVKGNKYDIEVEGKMEKCIYCGCEFGYYVFEIVGTTKLVYKKNFI